MENYKLNLNALYGKAPKTPVHLLGFDDWLIYGRTSDGRLVYTVVETDWHWLEMPYRGAADYGSHEWRIDNSSMLLYVTRNIDKYEWRECDSDPVTGQYMGWGIDKDDEFERNSRQNYLCD